MAKPNWGKKLKCQSCGAAFYDMNEPKPSCPKCETEYAPVVKSRRGSTPQPAPVAKKVAAPAPAETADDDEEDLLLAGDDDLDAVLEDDDDDDDSLIEDTSDLDDSDDDLGEIKEHVEVNIEDKE